MGQSNYQTSTRSRRLKKKSFALLITSSSYQRIMSSSRSGSENQPPQDQEEDEMEKLYRKIISKGYISSSLRPGSYRSRLKTIAKVLREITQDDDDHIVECNDLFDDLMSKSVIKAADNHDDIKLYLANCLIEVVRVLAPESPYLDRDTNKHVFEIIISSLKNFNLHSKSVDLRHQLASKLKKEFEDRRDETGRNDSGAVENDENVTGPNDEQSVEFKEALLDAIANDDNINEMHIEFYNIQLGIIKLFLELEAYVLLNQFNDMKLVMFCFCFCFCFVLFVSFFLHFYFI